MNKKIKITGMIILVSCFSVSMHACVITIINDSSDKILIRDINNENKAQYVILKGKMRRVGNPDKHANFEIYTKKTNNSSFDLAYECKQNECVTNKNPHIKLSDFSNNPDSLALFTVINHQKGASEQKYGQKPAGCCGGH